MVSSSPDQVVQWDPVSKQKQQQQKPLKRAESTAQNFAYYREKEGRKEGLQTVSETITMKSNILCY